MCGHAVSMGDRHSWIDCPPPRGKTGEHARRKRLRKKQARRNRAFEVKRGESIAFIREKGKIKGVKHGTGQVKNA